MGFAAEGEDWGEYSPRGNEHGRGQRRTRGMGKQQAGAGQEPKRCCQSSLTLAGQLSNTTLQ
jgi:hypothetical protein